MKRIIITLILVLAAIAGLSAAERADSVIEVYCNVSCTGYNLMKSDVNVMVDFGIAEKGADTPVWICNPENGKRMSFSSPMAVLAFMARNGWTYRDVYPVTVNRGESNEYEVLHYIMSKEVPVDYTPADVTGNIYFRQ